MQVGRAGLRRLDDAGRQPVPWLRRILPATAGVTAENRGEFAAHPVCRAQPAAVSAAIPARDGDILLPGAPAPVRGQDRSGEIDAVAGDGSEGPGTANAMRRDFAGV